MSRTKFERCPFTGKVSFATAEEAKRAMRTSQKSRRDKSKSGRRSLYGKRGKSGKRGKMPERIYSDCPCGQWHMTHKERPTARDIPTKVAVVADEPTVEIAASPRRKAA